MISTRLSWCVRLSVEAVASSFWTGMATKTNIPITAIDPAMAGGVRIETEEVVTFDFSFGGEGRINYIQSRVYNCPGSAPNATGNTSQLHSQLNSRPD